MEAADRSSPHHHHAVARPDRSELLSIELLGAEEDALLEDLRTLQLIQGLGTPRLVDAHVDVVLGLGLAAGEPVLDEVGEAFTGLVGGVAERLQLHAAEGVGFEEAALGGPGECELVGLVGDHLADRQRL